jgi:hypothetical protein
MFSADGSGGEAIPGLSYLSSTALGIIILLALFGWVWFKPAVEEIKASRDRAERQRDDLIKTYEDEIIPVLREVQTQLIPVLAATTAVLNDVRKELEFKQRQDRG